VGGKCGGPAGSRKQAEVLEGNLVSARSGRRIVLERLVRRIQRQRLGGTKRGPARIYFVVAKRGGRQDSRCLWRDLSQ